MIKVFVFDMSKRVLIAGNTETPFKVENEIADTQG